MKYKKETFASVLQSHGYRYDLRPVFDDFLMLTLCAFSQNPLTGKSHDEDLYMETIAKYPKEMANVFAKLLALLIVEMEERVDSHIGNDVLGDFYELNFCRKGTGQFFTPWPLCQFMASCQVSDSENKEGPLRVLDPTCGSGRMLLAGKKSFGRSHEYYGIDIDLTCVKMAAVNLFLNGAFHSEIMCADALMPDDFRVSYAMSFLPFGVYRITDREKSRLWHMYKSSFLRPAVRPGILLPSEENKQVGNGSQLQLF